MRRDCFFLPPQHCLTAASEVGLRAKLTKLQYTYGFHAVPEFAGLREGYVFKMAPRGLGYYRDS